ncbi:MAG: hypothetical protein N3A63_04825 [Bacteroidetes bacterium]|nr:hypothetical protein [Bacteroidota bacterium]
MKKVSCSFGWTLMVAIALWMVASVQLIEAQVQGHQEIRWMRVSSLHHWFSNGVVEIEYGRRSRSQLTTDQLDGLNWPGEYTLNKGVNVGKSLWIGTTNFKDPVTNQTYPYKVVSLGRLNLYIDSDVFPVEFKLIGKFPHPSVIVDGVKATERDIDDVVDEYNPNLPCDRMIYNRAHTSIGITITRRVYAFTQQYHDNYFIYEYEFVNTGIIDNKGTKMNPHPTLTGVVFHWQHRYGFAGESYQDQPPWAPTGASWGLNTINDAVGQDPSHTLPPPNNFRAVLSYYGPVSTEGTVDEDIGRPNPYNGKTMAGTCFAGVVVLHADKSSTDHSDDPKQPTTTRFMGSDKDAQTVNQYDAALMTLKYQYMTAGHPTQTHAEQIGKNQWGWPTGFANTWGGDPGGYAAAQGFGPYTMAPNDTIRIIFAEGVAGIMNDRALVNEIAQSWFKKTPPRGLNAYPLPPNAPTPTTTDRNEYKNWWVFTGKDSLFQTFRRAIENFKSGYSIPQPPPPPSKFMVQSGGKQITLTWEGPEAEAHPNFDGYEVYRSEGRTDTTFSKIFSCNKSNLTHTFVDRTARRGFNYYYYIVSKDDGTRNTVQPGVPLVSSKFYTMTNTPAYLTRLPGERLSDIRIVPNPWNIRSRSLYFGLDPTSQDRLVFYELPPYCVIRIYTETGDLIETINHTDGSGVEFWHSLTSSRQVVVSGVYIAYIEVTSDYYNDQGELVFKKGDNVFKKFIIIR